MDLLLFFLLRRNSLLILFYTEVMQICEIANNRVHFILKFVYLFIYLFFEKFLRVYDVYAYVALSLDVVHVLMTLFASFILTYDIFFSY